MKVLGNGSSRKATIDTLKYRLNELRLNCRHAFTSLVSTDLCDEEDNLSRSWNRTSNKVKGATSWNETRGQVREEDILAECNIPPNQVDLLLFSLQHLIYEEPCRNHKTIYIY